MKTLGSYVIRVIASITCLLAAMRTNCNLNKHRLFQFLFNSLQIGGRYFLMTENKFDFHYSKLFLLRSQEL